MITMTCMAPVPRYVVPGVRIVTLHVVIAVPGAVVVSMRGGRRGMSLVCHLLSVVTAMTVPAWRSARGAAWVRAVVVWSGHGVPSSGPGWGCG